MRPKYSLPGPRSAAMHADPAAARYIAGRPENETHLDIVLADGAGAVVRDVDGHRFLDFSACLNLPFGHEHGGWPEAGPVINSSNYMTPARLELVTLLATLLPMLDGFQFRSSGAEAVEAALRYSRQCQPHASLLSLTGCYHGLTLAVQQMMGNTLGREPVTMLPFPTPGDGEAATRSELGAALSAGPVVLAIEVVQGSTLRTLPNSFIEFLIHLKADYGDRLCLFLDDMLASVRCGSWCSLPEALPPDMFVAGKSWSGGFPFSLFGVSSAIRRTGGDILGTTTYGGNPMACRAAVNTIRRIQNDNILGHITRCAAGIQDLTARWQRLPGVQRVSCHGLLFGVELDTLALSRAAGIALMEQGVLCARIGRLLRFSPPLNIDLAQLQEGLDTVTDVLQSVGSQVGRV